MLILDEHSKPVSIDNIHAPTLSTHFWIFDFKMLDYCLASLNVLEESKTPVMTLDIGGYQFTIPCKWNVLIVDPDTSQLDLIDIATLAGRDFPILAFDHIRNIPVPVTCRIVGYNPEGVIVCPSIHRHELLCHPISVNLWINITPNDMIQKYIREMVMGDLF